VWPPANQTPRVVPAAAPPAGALQLGPLRLPRPRRGALYASGWYAWLTASNLLLRFSWAHRLVGDLEAHDAVLMAVALLEVVRRWQWTYARFENELRQLGALPLAREGGGAAPAPGTLFGQDGKAPAQAAGDGDWLDRASFGGSESGSGGATGAPARLHAATAVWGCCRAQGRRSGAAAAGNDGDVESAVASPAARSSSGSGGEEGGGAARREQTLATAAAAALTRLTERHHHHHHGGGAGPLGGPPHVASH
jgi:hypothetical protein